MLAWSPGLHKLTSQARSSHVAAMDNQKAVVTRQVTDAAVDAAIARENRQVARENQESARKCAQVAQQTAEIAGKCAQIAQQIAAEIARQIAAEIAQRNVEIARKHIVMGTAAGHTALHAGPHDHRRRRRQQRDPARAPRRRQ